ncbi:MAG: hypothetical protein U5K51_14250 [Flavobacteriaceae bacterium]|nr:hypothetical protein [Flavobacteriaceae bacterium]
MIQLVEQWLESGNSHDSLVQRMGFHFIPLAIGSRAQESDEAIVVLLH